VQHPAPTVTGADAALFERVLSLALGETHRLLERALESTRHALQKLEDLARTPGERHGLIESRQQLVRLSALMAERYPGALRQAIAQDALDQSKTTRSLFSVHFDELELMDEHQIHASVERARVREVLAEATDAALAEFDALVSAALGLASVQPGRNPLRPDVFLQALQTVLGQMQVSEAVRRDWMTPMAQALGAELRDFYGRLTAQLRQAGIKPIGYAIRQADGRHAYVAVDAAQGHTPGFAAAAPHENTVAAVPRPGRPGAPPPAAHPQQEALLTLERLRRLLQGELDPGQAPGRMERFAQQFSDTFDGLHDAAQAESPPDFDVTVPAAFEALQEMKQVDRLVERLGRQRAAGQAQEPAAARLGQALGQEVVALMVDNLAQDQRLLPPVQDVVRQLEPALLRLAVDDPRFFSDPEHPARRLLQEITDRSLGFEDVQTPGFESFLLALHECTEPLAQADASGGQEGFETVLHHLHERWAAGEQARERERARAVESLWRAEQRHLLAARIARQIQHLPEFRRVPAEVGAFLVGPWSQVLAQARLSNTDQHPDPGRYRELVDALLWSAQPEQTRKNPAQLARLVPKLLDRLRQGLASIGYPEQELAAFLDTLMRLHQMALQAPAADRTAPGSTSAAPPALPIPPPPAPPPAAEPAPAPPPTRAHAPIAPIEDEPWLVPAEARESGFMEAGPAGMAAGAAAEPPAGAPDMPAGAWVDLRVGEHWERTQLTWAGPHGTLFLFTSANGRSQSMTKRLRDRLFAQGSLRIVSEHTMVGEALDAVARTAMRNSVDTRH